MTNKYYILVAILSYWSGNCINIK